MKIVVLDGYALNPGDLSWAPLQEMGELTVYDRTVEAEIIERAAEADILLTNKVPVRAHIIESLPQLKYIGVMATGYNIIDIACARKNNIIVSNIPGYSTASVVQLTFSLLLELCYHTQRHSDAVVEGKWSASPDFCFWDFPLKELSEKTLGIIGLGSIGQQVADVAAAFGMSVLAYSRTQTNQSHRTNFRWVADPAELFAQADVISLHCPQTPQTENIINSQSLAMMKSSAIIINTSRGGLINAADLADALNEGRISAAGIDVLAVEPPPANNPLLGAKNCLITPHIGWATLEARSRLMNILANNLKTFIARNPTNTL